MLLEIAREKYETATEPEWKASHLLDMARQHIELQEPAEAGCALAEFDELAKSIESDISVMQIWRLEQGYKLEMLRGNNGLAVELLERYVEECKREDIVMPFRMQTVYEAAARDAECLGHKGLAERYGKMGGYLGEWGLPVQSR